MAVTTTLVSNLGLATLDAAFDITAKGSSAADLDRRHHAPLATVEMESLGHAVGWTVAAEDIRHLERGPVHTIRSAVSGRPERTLPGR
jgi:hypothetical protein